MQLPRLWSTFILVVLMSGLAGCQWDSDSRSADDRADHPASDATVAENDPVKLTVLDFAGIERLIASKHGKVVVMDGWSTSCQPCMKEFHNLVQLHDDYGPDRVACISLSFDYEGIDPVEVVQEPVLKFLRSHRATFDNVLSSDDNEALYRKFDLASVPAVFVYDRRGKLRQRFDSTQSAGDSEGSTYQRVRRLVDELLAEPQ